MYSGAWLDCKNAFSRVYLPDLDDSKKRKPIPIENIRQIQQDCREEDDEARWLVALISDTGMRLSEAAGLHINDIILDDDIPLYQPNPSSLEKLKDQRQSEADTACRCIAMGCSKDKERPSPHFCLSLDTTPPHPPMPTQHQLPSTNGSNQECQRMCYPLL